ncbi:MAG TPA: hypothetical protein PKM88_13490, partial [bacterium]|nr:hypothetical protein [bacterium]
MNILNTRFIGKEQVRQWGLYAEQLKQYPRVKEHLEPMMYHCVQHIDNPLSIEWVRCLLQGRVDWMEQMLAAHEQNIGADNVSMVFDELKKEKTKSARNLGI